MKLKKVISYQSLFAPRGVIDNERHGVLNTFKCLFLITLGFRSLYAYAQIKVVTSSWLLYLRNGFLYINLHFHWFVIVYNHHPIETFWGKIKEKVQINQSDFCTYI